MPVDVDRLEQLEDVGAASLDRGVAGAVRADDDVLAAWLHGRYSLKTAECAARSSAAASSLTQVAPGSLQSLKPLGIATVWCTRSPSAIARKRFLTGSNDVHWGLQALARLAASRTACCLIGRPQA